MHLERRSFLTLLAAAPAAFPQKSSSTMLVYFGTYTRKTSKGVYVAKLDTATGKVSEPELAGEVSNPSFVTIHPNQKYLYAVSEMGGGGAQGGGVTAFSIDKPSGKLTRLNQVSSKGSGPCHLNVDKTGRTLVVANYGSGSVAAMPVKPDGSLGDPVGFIQHAGSSVDKRRQAGPHAHSVNYSANNKFVIAADLGLDQVLVYKVDPATASLTPNNPPFAKVKPGGGPRHFTFHPKGKFAYVINEMGQAVTAFAWNAGKGALTEIQHISTLPDGVTVANNTTAEVVAHPNGKFLYGSNRGHNSIAVFSIAKDGKLTRVENAPTQGEIPRNFAIDPSGKWLFAANQNTDNVVIFAIDQATGKLSPTGQQLKVDVPVCVRFAAL
ncbi:MAG: lactonase family protein [Bryobacterales bacterium]|nr:lactonase family protein [Bryobacterales bacterium]